MYKTYIETKHENCDRLGPSKMGQAGYLLTCPRMLNTDGDMRSLQCFCRLFFAIKKSIINIHKYANKLICKLECTRASQ